MKKSTRTCVECGNNQTNHTLTWFGNTTGILFTPLDKVLVNNFLGKLLGRSIDRMTKPYLQILHTCHLIRWNTDSTKALTKRSEVIWDEAKKRGITMKQLVILNKPVEFYTATLKNGRQLFFESVPQTKKGFIESYAWMDDKSILKKKLQQKSIATPYGGSVWTFNQARKIFNAVQKPVIIKPRVGSRGRHTTTFLYTEEDLKKAYDSAKKLCFFVVVEEHLIGSVYRGTCINGVLYGVLEGMPPRITGDGISTITELITIKNEESKNSTVKAVVKNDKLSTFLSRIGYTEDTVLPKDITIDVSEKVGLSYGGDSRELFPETHPEIRKEIERAAVMVDAGVIGFDFIIQDPTKDPANQKWGIIECNSLPFINLHHFPNTGEPVDIAQHIWNEIEKQTQTKK